MPKRTRNYRENLLEDLMDLDAAIEYLNAAADEPGNEMLLLALRDVAEARQMAQVAEDSGVARESIYRMLSASGNPQLDNFRGILKALKLKVKFEREDNGESGPRTEEPGLLGVNTTARPSSVGGRGTGDGTVDLSRLVSIAVKKKPEMAVERTSGNSTQIRYWKKEG